MAGRGIGWKVGTAALLGILGLALTAEGGENTAASEAEAALNAIVAATLADDGFAAFALGRPGAGTGRAAAYRGMFSDALRQAWAKADAAALPQSCGGVLDPGRGCGLAINPFSCAQDGVDSGRVVKSRLVAPDIVAIDYSWPWEYGGYTRYVAEYRLIRVQGRWQVDGVRCDFGAAFNMDR